MADSVAKNLLAAPKPQEIFPNTLPPELCEFIFAHFNVVTLMKLSATSRILHLRVHDFFTNRLSEQAKKYPEMRESLSRLSWKKKHDHWSCDCFQLVAGPGFTWRQERKFLSSVSGQFAEVSTNTTVAGKTFFLTSDKEVIFFKNSTENNMMPRSPHTLVSFKSSLIDIGPLSSYDQVLAFSLKKPNVGQTICIYSPTTLTKITEIDLIAYDSKIPEDIRNVEVDFIAFGKDTMAIDLIGNDRYILMWKINTKKPQEEGIGFLGTIVAPPISDLLENAENPLKAFLLNDRFIAVIEDDQVKVLNRSNQVVRQIDAGVAWGLATWALEKEQGDHIAFAFTFIYNGAHQLEPKIVFQIYSVTRGNIIIQKELLGAPHPNVPYMKWFGPHLVVILEKDNVLSMMSWQPGLTSFLPCPLNVQVVRRSSRAGGGGETDWGADIVHVDFGGVTIAITNYGYESKNYLWRHE